MSLSGRVVLEIDPIPGSNGEPGVFPLKTDLKTTDNLDRGYLMANRGQHISAIASVAADLIPDEIVSASENLDRREGITVDGGAGKDQKTITATRGVEETSQWGNEDLGEGEESTMYAAAPGDLDAHADVLDYWLNETRSDSQGQTQLYLRGHCSGKYSDEAGVYGEPITVTVLSHTINQDDQSEIEITLETERTATVPSVEEALDGVEDAIDDVVDELAEYTPDW